MDNSNLFFRGQMEDEEIINFTRKHWVTILPDLFPFLFFISIVLALALNLHRFNLPSIETGVLQLVIILALGMTAISIHRFFLRMINYFMGTVIITNYRLVEIKKTLFIQDSKESLDLRKIQDIQLQQSGFIRSVLKFGNLMITLGNSDTRTIYLIPNADYFFRLINKLKNEQIVKRYDDLLNRPHQSLNPYPDNFPYLLHADLQSVEDKKE